MRFFRKLFVLILILVLLGCSFLFIIGYSSYSKALNEKPLKDRIQEITSDEHFVVFEDLSKFYTDAVVAVEDHRYYDHGAIDPIGIARALFVNVKNRELQEGGSTITQQVAKNVVFSQEDTLSRKTGEILAAFDLEKNYSKEQILAFYVNTCYFGDGYYGIYDASMGYYKKKPKDLTLDEASMLAGVPNAPSLYSPNVNMDLAKKRQQHVLKKMVQYGYISQSESDGI